MPYDALYHIIRASIGDYTVHLGFIESVWKSCIVLYNPFNPVLALLLQKQNQDGIMWTQVLISNI